MVRFRDSPELKQRSRRGDPPIEDRSPACPGMSRPPVRRAPWPGAIERTAAGCPGAAWRGRRGASWRRRSASPSRSKPVAPDDLRLPAARETGFHPLPPGFRPDFTPIPAVRRLGGAAAGLPSAYAADFTPPAACGPSSWNASTTSVSKSARW